MVRPPYWVAARIYAAAATGIGRARISGTYTLNTGQELEDLPPKLYLDVVEAWYWDHFTDQKDVDSWQHDLAAPPRADWTDIWGVVRRGALANIAVFEAVLAGTEPAPSDESPPGWSDDELLIEALRMTGGQQIVE